MLRALAEAAPAAALAAVGLLGLAIGSFLNVVIVRLPERRSLWRPGSACPGCGAPIAWYDNLPLLSFALLRGRCVVARGRDRRAPRWRSVRRHHAGLRAPLPGRGHGPGRRETRRDAGRFSRLEGAPLLALRRRLRRRRSRDRAARDRPARTQGPDPVWSLPCTRWSHRPFLGGEGGGMVPERIRRLNA